MNSMNIKPLTVLQDKYSGKREFTAWNKNKDDIPKVVFSNDVQQLDDFWNNNNEPVGLGDTKESAIHDLYNKLSVASI